MDIKIDDYVQTRYNSGVYIGKVIEFRGNFILVETLAVLTHPEQGDLHNRGVVSGVAFHERKALAYKEKFNARKRDTEKYTGEVPSYVSSLKDALTTFKQKLIDEDTAFNKLSLARVEDLETHFYDKIFENERNV